MSAGGGAVIAIVGKLVNVESVRSGWKSGDLTGQDQVGVLAGLLHPDVSYDIATFQLDLGN